MISTKVCFLKHTKDGKPLKIISTKNNLFKKMNIYINDIVALKMLF